MEPTRIVTYGVGGYDPDKPDNNVIEVRWVDEDGNPVDAPGPEQIRAAAEPGVHHEAKKHAAEPDEAKKHGETRGNDNGELKAKDKR